MDRKGFTLIELLAVIIIIGIIATITIVSISDTLKTSKNGLSKIQINNVEKAAESYYIKEGMAEEVSCISVADLINKDYIEQTEVINPKTREPMNGSVKITYEANQYSYEYSEDECGGIIARAVTEENKTLAGNIPKGNYEPGDEYIVNVDGTQEYHFYVLSTEGDKVNLIMSNNICSDGTLAKETNKCLFYWLSKEDYNDDTNYGDFGNNDKGPITPMNGIYDATKRWSNIENIEINYVDEENHYGKIQSNGITTKIMMKDGTVTASYENLKARLPMKFELEKANCTTDFGSCSPWIVNGLDTYVAGYPEGTKENIESIYAYWSLSSSESGAYKVGSYGNYSEYDINYDDQVGIRPVISISKSYFAR